MPRSAARTGMPGQVDQVEDVRVDELGREVERQHVEIACRAVRVDGEQRQSVLTEQRLEVGPRGVGPLGHGVGPLVQDLIQDLQALVGQPDLVRVGVGQQPGHLRLVVHGRLRSVFAADVAGRLLDLGEQRLELGPESHDPGSLPSISA